MGHGAESLTEQGRVEPNGVESTERDLIGIETTGMESSTFESNTMSLSTLEREAIEFTGDLIRIESVNTGDRATIGDGEARACRYIQERLEEVGYHCDYFESTPGRGNLVTRITGQRSLDSALPGGALPGGALHDSALHDSALPGGALIVSAHVDVVPADPTEWTYPPFGGEIHDGWLYGRGAVDMKDMAAVMLAVAREYARESVVPKRDLIFAFFADEEANGTDGASWMVSNHPECFVDASQALTEVGGFSLEIVPGRRVYPVATAEKGVGWAKLTAKGVAGHASKPTADNAVVAIARAVSAVASHQFPLQRTQALDLFLAGLSELTGTEFTEDAIENRLQELGFLSDVIGASLRNTATPTIIKAGYKINVIPNDAYAEIDCRVLPGSEETFCIEVEKIIYEEVGDVVSVEWVWQPPIKANADDPLVDKMAKALLEYDPDGVVIPYLLPASTDNKHLSRLGIEGYGWVPLKVPADFDVFGHFHAKDERVPVSALAFCANVMSDFLREA